jgi:hypothetical protein
VSLLTRDQIFAAPPLAYEDIEIAEWGGVVRLREMTAGEQQIYAALLLDEQQRLDLTNYEAKLLTCTICDEAGALLFAPGDIGALSRLAAEPIGRLWKIAASLNHFAVGDLEALGKELAVRSGVSFSGLPSSSDAPSERSNGA